MQRLPQQNCIQKAESDHKGQNGILICKQTDAIQRTLRTTVKAMEPVSYTHLDVYKRQALISLITNSKSSYFKPECAL